VRETDWFIGLDGSGNLRDLSSGTRHDLLLSNGFGIGAMLRNPATPINFLDGSICEVVMLSSSLGETDRQKLEGYLAHKWGLAANLPGGHPYEDTAPTVSGAVAFLDGTVSDPDDDPLTSTWSLVSGPGTVTFADASTVDTTATFTTPGTYTLRLTADDGFGSDFDEVMITVAASTTRSVSYNGNGSTGGSVPVDGGNPYESGDTVTVLGEGDLVKTGYAFSGWNTAADGSGSSYAADDTFEITENTTLYAQWTANSYMVTFDANGGGTPSPASITATYDAAYGPLAVTNHPGHSFIGWFTAPTGGGEVTAATTVVTAADHTLYAHWNALPDVDAGPDQTVSLDELLPWTPAQMTTAAWFDAADATTITASGGAVSQWNDKSGNGNHASQANDLVRPTSGTTAIGGLNAISIRVGAGTNKQFLTAPDHASLKLDASGGVNVFSVMRYLGYVNQGSTLNVPFSKGEILSAIASYGIRVSDTQVLAFRSGLNAQPGAGSGFLGQDIIYSGTRNDSTLTAQLHINGSLGGSVTSATPITSDNTNPLHIGRDPSTGRYADVDFGEIIVAGGTLSPDNRQKLEGYLAHKWSLAEKLPAGHPYEDTAPGSLVATAILSGSATDAEGDPLTHAWSVVSGNAAAVSFANPSAAATTATFTEEGVYTLRLTSGDGFGSSHDDVVITVGDVTPPSPFETWAGGGDITFNGDSNVDGIADGLAWLLGAGNPAENANALMPQAGASDGDLTLTFNLLKPANRGSATLGIQYSRDLGIADDWNDNTVAVPDVTSTVDGVTFIITPIPDTDLNQVQATIPGSPTEADRLFARLKATP
jgi:uncharacterized repeat protein (TIGR02543 family)